MAPRRTLVSEATLAGLRDGAVLEVSGPFVITPSAAALARQRRIEIRPRPEGPGSAASAPESAPAVLPSHIESTLLDAGATPEMIDDLCDEAKRLGLAGVCVAPCHVRRAAKQLEATAVRVVTVAGFPLGSSCPETKAFEASRAGGDGATEVDMVIAVGLLRAGLWRAVYDDIVAVRRALSHPGLVLKVIIEAPDLTPQQIVEASLLAVEAGADFVKTGTGRRGPAEPGQVSLIRRVVGDRARIKAAGGIRTAAGARLLLAAGADRLGSSAARQLLLP